MVKISMNNVNNEANDITKLLMAQIYKLWHKKRCIAHLIIVNC